MKTSTSFPIKIVCASLNFTRLDDISLSNLKSASFSSVQNAVEKFKRQLDFPVKQLAIVQKCNAVMIIFTHTENIADTFLKHRILDTWQKLSHHGIINFSKRINFFYDEAAVRYIGEAALGIHSVTIGDSQVFAQVYDAIHDSGQRQAGSPIFSILATWIKEMTDEVREKTVLFSGNTSLERIAVNQLIGRVDVNSKILVVGAGQSGSLLVKILSEEYKYQVILTNRNKSKIEEIVSRYPKVAAIDIKDASNLQDIQAIFWALDNNSETHHYFSALESSLGSKVPFLVDLSTPSLKSKSSWTILDIKYFSKEAKKTLAERSGAVNQTRQILEKNILFFMTKIKNALGKISIDSQKTCASTRLPAEMLEVIKVRSAAFNSVRQYLLSRNFYEINTPYIVGISTDPPKVDDGGAIEVAWPGGERAFLRQSNQMYKQMVVASGMDKIFEIGPFWRAETENSCRHLQESIGLDVEFEKPASLQNLIELARDILISSYQAMKQLSLPVAELNLPQDGFPILTYREAVDLLNENGFSFQYGSDPGVIGEAKLGEIIKKKRGSDIFAISCYPSSIKKFYTKRKGTYLTETFDIIMCGWELGSGAIRETDRKKIEYSMKLSDINPNDYSFYLSIIDNAVEHGGFCLGLDRMVAKFLDMAIISDCVPFPRTFSKLVP